MANTRGGDRSETTNIEFTIFFSIAGSLHSLLAILSSFFLFFYRHCFIFLSSSCIVWGYRDTDKFPYLPFLEGSSIQPSSDGRSRRNWLTTTTKRRDVCHLLRKYSTVNFTLYAYIHIYTRDCSKTPDTRDFSLDRNTLFEYADSVNYGTSVYAEYSESAIVLINDSFTGLES